MPTWAGIIRISHLGDRVVGSDSLRSDKSQEKAIRNAVPPGHSLDLLPPEYDISGGLPLDKRPSLRQAVRGVESGKYAGIVVAYQSRLFRNTIEEEAVFSRVEAAGGEIIMALDPVDNRTVDGRMVRRIKSAMNVAERERHTEAFEDAAREATQRGIWQRRQIPLGYAKDPTTRKLVIDPPAAAKVRRAFTDRLAGKPISTIARDLELTPGGTRALLRNRLYLGELRVRSYVNTKDVPPIVDTDLWEAVQYARVTRPPKRDAHPALLAGLVRCAGCGHVMARSGVSYACARHHSDGPCPDPASITIRILDEHVEAIALRELANVRARSVRSDNRIPALRANLRDATRELATYLEAVQAAGLAADTFAAGARKRQGEVDAARETLSIALAAQPVQLQGDAVAVWPRLDGTRRNHLLCGLLEAVVVRKAGRGHAIPVADRTRVVKHGAGLFRTYGGGGRPLPVVACFPDADDPVVLRVHVDEDALERGGG